MFILKNIGNSKDFQVFLCFSLKNIEKSRDFQGLPKKTLKTPEIPEIPEIFWNPGAMSHVRYTHPQGSQKSLESLESLDFSMFFFVKLENLWIFYCFVNEKHKNT